MLKKIKISERPSLFDVFNDTLERVDKEERKYALSYNRHNYDDYGYAYNYYDGWDNYNDDCDEDYWGDIYRSREREIRNAFSVNGNKRNKGHKQTRRGSGYNKRGSKRKHSNNQLNIRDFCGDYEDEIDDNDVVLDSTSYMHDSKTIYYYPDYENKNDRQVFHNLMEFDCFVEEEGINISKEEVDKLMYRAVSHCSINPKDKDIKSELNLISEHSYGALYTECTQLEYAYSRE